MSATVPGDGQSESDVLDVRAEVWKKRPLLREIYNRYFAEMVKHFAVDRAGSFGTILELGGGSGNFKEFFEGRFAGHGQLIATDVVPTVHCDLAVDAMALPFADGTVDTIVMQDVLHHIPYPLKFFAEAERALRPGGRVVMTEPYISPFSRVVFGLTHPEPVILSTLLFAEDGSPDPCPFSGTGAFASNQATPKLLFFRDRRKFEARFPKLVIRERILRSCFVYPLSGGFSGPKVLPRFVEPVAWGVEKLLTPLAGLLAFRLLAVVEKRA